MQVQNELSDTATPSWVLFVWSHGTWHYNHDNTNVKLNLTHYKRIQIPGNKLHDIKIFCFTMSIDIVFTNI